jgi:tetratricopeptide (TPR) repeat protein
METLAKLEELEQKFGENPRRYFAALANEYRKNGEFEQAIELCRAQLEQQPEHLSGRVVLGQALFDAFRYEEARTELTTAIELDPENFIALRLLGELAAQDGDQDTAREFLSRARDIEPRNEQLLAALAALGPVEPPVTLSAAVAQTAVAAAEPIVEPFAKPVTQPAPEPAPEPAVERAAAPVAEPAVERFAESALGPRAPAPAPHQTGAKAKAQPAPVLAVQPPAETAAPPIPEPAAEGPLRRERPAAFKRERKPTVQRVEGLVPTTLEPEKAVETAAELVARIETEAAALRREIPETQIDTASAARDTAAKARAAEVRPAEVRGAEAGTAEERAIEAPVVEPEPIETQPTEPEAAAVETETPPEPRATIVTETMADLYLEQGHRTEAIEVLRQLVSQRPEDERLSRRLADLEATPAVSTVRDFFARLGARGGGAAAPPAPAAAQSKGSVSAVFGESASTLLDPESAALVAVTMPEPTATPTDNEFENWVSRRRKP